MPRQNLSPAPPESTSQLPAAGLFEAVFQNSPCPMGVVRAADLALLAVNESWRQVTRAGAGSSALGIPVQGVLARAVQACLAGSAGARVERGAGEGPVRPMRLSLTDLKTGAEDLRLVTLAEEAEGPPMPKPVPLSGDLLSANQVLQLQMQPHPAIEKLARVGHWIASDSSQGVVWSPGLYAIAGLAPRDEIPQSEGRFGIHADDWDAWNAARQALDGRDVDYRWTRPNGDLRWLRSRMGRTELPGQSMVAFGVVQDVTEEREAKLGLATELDFVRHIAAHVPGAIYRARRALDGSPSVSFVSASCVDVLGVEAQDVMRDQRQFFSSIVPEDLPGLLATLDRSCEDLSTMRAAFRADVPKLGRRWIQAEAATQREADGGIVWHGFITDVTDRLEASRALDRQHRMLQAVQRAQAAFIELEDKRKAFDGLLASFLTVTECGFGFVGEVLFDAQDQPFLRMHAVTDISWDEATRKTVASAGDGGLEFHSLQTLFGHSLQTGETVISNDPVHDPRAGGLPPGHPHLSSFLAVPISLSGKLIAMVGLANKPDGFDAADVAFLQPLLGTVRELVMASRSHAQFQATSALLADKTEALQETFASINQGLTRVDAEGRVRFYNQRMLELLGIPESVYLNQPLHADIVKYQQDRGDFGEGLRSLPDGVRPYALGEAAVTPQHYVRRTPQGKMLEVLTRHLPDGGFVRTYTDVTSYFDAQEALREERQRLQWVLEATRPGIWEVNLETMETTYSERWASMLGYEISDFQSSTVDTFLRLIHPQDVDRVKRVSDMHLKGDTAYYDVDFRMHHRNGHWMWVNDRGRVHRRDTTGKPLYMSGTLLDIHDRVAAQEEVSSLNASLERRVTERTAELERSMKDMEAISYSIAHDLRAPLRSVNGFATLISEDASGQLSPESRRMFERIANSSRNMGQMITDMLELLRVVRVDLDAVPVNMNQLAHSVSESLGPGTPHALIGIKPLPAVMGDATLLRQVLSNLMDNALKYARHRPQPELVLGFDERRRAFYLRDNGMGFDMARAGKLFGLFQRMHAGSDVPGTGVGLAIVARIVERHGGRIWANAVPGEGATFWWTLPQV